MIAGETGRGGEKWPKKSPTPLERAQVGKKRKVFQRNGRENTIWETKNTRALYSKSLKTKKGEIDKGKEAGPAFLKSFRTI